MTKPGLAGLIYSWDLDRAVELANQLNPQEIRTRIFRDDEGLLNHKLKCDVFLRRRYEIKT